MTKLEKYRKGFLTVSFGLIFITSWLTVQLSPEKGSTVEILPDFIGWILIWTAIPYFFDDKPKYLNLICIGEIAASLILFAVHLFTGFSHMIVNILLTAGEVYAVYTFLTRMYDAACEGDSEVTRFIIPFRDIYTWCVPLTIVVSSLPGVWALLSAITGVISVFVVLGIVAVSMIVRRELVR